MAARDMLYELLTNCIPADVIIKTLTKEMLKVMDDTVKHELVYWATHYEHRIQVNDPTSSHTPSYYCRPQH